MRVNVGDVTLYVRAEGAFSRAVRRARRTTPAAAALRLALLLPDADEVVIPAVAHMLLDEQPEAALTALRALLGRVPA